MPITGENKKVQEEGKEKDALVVSFTNGAKDQLKELREFFKAPSELEIIKLGISILQNFKDKAEQEKQKILQSKSQKHDQPIRC